MKCAHCATNLVADARFCPQCGQPTQGEKAPRAAAASSSADTAAEQANLAAETNALEGVESLVSGKVMTSPFPPLPETAASLALPGKKLSGSAVHALLAQANLNRMRRQYDEAVDCCVSVLRAQPANQSAHVLLGDVYRDQRRWDDAIQWYGMAVELRPNPTDQAKLEQVQQERERAARSDAQRVRRGYGSAAAAIDRGTDLNTGTVNLMGVSPRRWLRGITVTSLAFAALVLIALVWNNFDKLTARWQGKSGTVVRGANGAFPSNGGLSLPPHRMDRTQPGYLAAQAANGDKTIVVGGGGMPPDRNTRTATVAPQTPTTPVPSNAPNNGTLLPGGAFSATPSGMTSNPNVPPAPVQSVRPLFVPSSPASVAVSTPQPSNRLTDGMQVIQTVGDGGVGATVLMTGAPSLLDGSARGQEIAIRNAYRAARTAFAGNNMLTRVKALVQTQVQGAGQAVVMEAELERGTALNSNPDTDSAGTLQGHLLSYRWTGVPTVSQPAPTAPNDSGTP